MDDTNETNRSAERFAMIEAYAAGELRKKLGLSPQILAMGLKHALGLLEVGRAEDALRLCAGIVLIEPGNINHLAALANSAIATGKAEVALNTASLMVILEPRNPLGYYFSALGCIGLDRMVEAQEDLRDALGFATQAGDDELARQAATMLARFRLN